MLDGGNGNERLWMPITAVFFEENKLIDNFNELMVEINRAKPASSKGDYIKHVYISSTMGPSIKVDLNL